MVEGAEAIRFINEINGIFDRIKTESWVDIDKASSVIADALLSGHTAYCVSEGHIPPFANAYGAIGNPHHFTPYELLATRLAFSSTVPMKGDVVVFIAQFDTSPFLDEIAAECKMLGAYLILVGTPTDRRIIPMAMPMLTLSQICDLTINVFTPPRDGLLKFNGLGVEACPVSGIVGVLLFNVLNIEVAERISKGMGFPVNGRDTEISYGEGTIDSPDFLRARSSRPPER